MLTPSQKRGMRRQGRPCKRCGGTLRYRSNGSCVACNTLSGGVPEREATLRAYHAKPEVAARKKAHAAKPENRERKRARAQCEGIAGRMLSSARRRAKESGLAFDIFLAPVEMRVRVGFCEATGLPFDLSPHGGKTRVRPFGPTIDRVDSTKGYTWGNIRIVCNAYNLAKNDFTEADVLRVALALAARHGWGPPSA